MTKTIIILVVAALALVLFSYCTASKKGQDTIATTCTPVLLDKDLYIKAVQRKPTDLITVKSASIEGDCLTLEVSTKCGKNKVSDFKHPGIDLEHQENLSIIFKGIDLLPDNQKTAFILSFIEDLPRQEVADIMELSLKAVESLLQRGKKKLRESLEKHYPVRRKTKK